MLTRVRPMLTVGLLAILAVGSITQLPGVTTPAPTSQAKMTTKRDVFYLSPRFGFRFIYPSGYNIAPAENLSAKPTPLEVLEVWNSADFQNRENLPESPPLINITVYHNPQKLPLTQWKGELSRNDDRALTVAGQPAIAYTSTGLYEYDNVLFSSPDRRQVFRLQVGYINKSDRLRQSVFSEIIQSFTFDVLNPSEPAAKWRINYNTLQQYLNARNWQAADVETRAILFRLVGNKGDLLFDSKTALNQIPCGDLRTLDNLWSKASRGRFGYAAQQRIWQQSRARSTSPQVEKFAQNVGWYKNRASTETNPVRVELGGTAWRFDTELNYTVNAPVGHLPWVGVSSSRLNDFLTERSLGCGSCTIDAMNLASDRYYTYLPALFNRVKACGVKASSTIDN